MEEVSRRFDDKVTCGSRLSESCLKEMDASAGSHHERNLKIIRARWQTLHDNEFIFGYVCPECMKAHVPGARRREFADGKP